MLMQVTNNLAVSLNALDSYLGFPGVPGVTAATGGAKVNPVPYPFDWYVFPANGVTGYNPTFAVHLRDFEKLDYAGRSNSNGSMQVGEIWNQLVQAGTVTLAFSSETGGGSRDVMDHVAHNTV